MNIITNNLIFFIFSRKVENVFQATAAEEDEHHEERAQRSTKEKRLFNQAYAEEITSKTLASFGDVCSVLRNPQRGLNAFNFSRSRSRNSKTKSIAVRNVNVYNSLLKGFAQKRDYNKIKEVLNLMKEAEVPLNIQSHIYVLECLGRIDAKDSQFKDIKMHVGGEIEDRSYFDHIINNGTYYEGQKDVVLKAMRYFCPSYQPKYIKPEMQYSNDLVNDLNNENKWDNIECDEGSKYTFTPKGLEAATRNQIELEKSGFVEVRFFVVISLYFLIASNPRF